MAHGDFIAYVSPEDAALVLELMDEVLVEVYQVPGVRCPGTGQPGSRPGEDHRDR